MKRRGRGIACMWYPIGFTVSANPSAAVVKINEDGTATFQYSLGGSSVESLPLTRIPF